MILTFMKDVQNIVIKLCFDHQHYFVPCIQRKDILCNIKIKSTNIEPVVPLFDAFYNAKLITLKRIMRRKSVMAAQAYSTKGNSCW